MKPIWSGLISFGLVNIPVKLYPATQEKSLDLDLLHKHDFSRIRYAKMCALEEKEVPKEEVVKGYQFETGHYVVLTDEDFEKVNLQKSKSITVINFLKKEDVDFIYYDKPYFLESNGGDKAYSLLRDILSEKKVVALATYILRNKEHIGIIDARSEILILEQLRYHNEIRDSKELASPKEELISEKEKSLAKNLIDQMTAKVNLDLFEDTYRKELERIIEQKKKGEIPTAKGKAPVATKVPDLMEVLKRSLNESQKTKTR